MLIEQIHLEADEKIIEVIRKHWFIIVTELAGLAFLACLPLLAEIFFASLPDAATASLPDLPALAPYFIFGSAAWVLIVLMMAAAAWTHYYLDLWVITTRRVVLIDQRGFFRRFISSFRLERLQDMNIEINGIIPTLLNFGTIEAQTAGGSNERFESKHMPDPKRIKATILAAAEALTSTQAARIETLKEQGL